MTNDFRFISRTVSVADDKRTKQGDYALTSEEQEASSIWAASGIIGNGSFQYFFECSQDAERCARAYEAIGLPKAALVFRLALSLFPNSQPHEDVDERVAYVKEREELFDNLAMEIIRLDPEMEERLSAYLKKAGFR